MICVTGSRPQLKEVATILRPLWSNGIKTGVIESSSTAGGGAVDDLGKEAGAKIVVLIGDGGELRVRSWDHDRFQERHVTRPDLIAYILKTFRSEGPASDGYASQTALQHSTGSVSGSGSSSGVSATLFSAFTNQPNSLSSGQSQPINGAPPLDLVFLTSEKVNTSKKRRYEHQVEHKLSPVLCKFHRKEKVTLIMVDLPNLPLRGLVGLIDPLECGTQGDDDSAPESAAIDRAELQTLCERYPKYKRQLMELYSEIVDMFVQSKGRTPIVGVYSVIDTFCRLIL